MGLKFPITIYDRQRGDDITQVDGSKVRKGGYIFTFGGDWLPMPNLFGDDRKITIDQYMQEFGYTVWIKNAEYKPDSKTIQVNIYVINIPDDPGGPTIAALPLVAIVAGIGAIVGGILVVTSLSKVQHIFELPVFYLVAGAAVLFAIPPVVKSFKAGGT